MVQCCEGSCGLVILYLQQGLGLESSMLRFDPAHLFGIGLSRGIHDCPEGLLTPDKHENTLKNLNWLVQYALPKSRKARQNLCTHTH